MRFLHAPRILALAAACVAAGAHAGTVNYYGSTDQYGIDTDFDNSAVTAVKNSVPSSGPSIGTFGHAREGFSAVPNLGTLYGGGANTALYIGDSYAGTGNRNAFDHSIVKITFENAILNGSGADIALMVASGRTTGTPSLRGHYVETVAVGVDASIATGNYSNTLWYEEASDYKNNATGANGYITFLYDLSDLGVADGASITDLYVSNFDVFSTVSGADGLSGWVNLAGGSGSAIQGAANYQFVGGTTPAGANSFYQARSTGTNSHFDTDPDLLYAGRVALAVPEPGTLGLVALALTGVGAAARRRRPAAGAA